MLADIVTTFTIMLNVSYLCSSNSFINKIKVKHKKLKVQLLEMGGRGKVWLGTIALKGHRDKAQSSKFPYF